MSPPCRTSLPSSTPLHPSRLPQSHWVELPVVGQTERVALSGFIWAMKWILIEMVESEPPCRYSLGWHFTFESIQIFFFLFWEYTKVFNSREEGEEARNRIANVKIKNVYLQQKGGKRCQKWQDHQHYLILTNIQVWSISKNIEGKGRKGGKKREKEGWREKERKQRKGYLH